MRDNFTNLHVHTEFSALDGAAGLNKLVTHVREIGQASIAITDHGNLHGAYNFYKECLSQGIKPILGCELYLSPSIPATEKRRINWGENSEGKNAISGGGSYTHLTVLATGAVGFRNLAKLSTESYANGFYLKPRTSIEALTEHGAGLIILSGCLSSELSTRLTLDQFAEASEYVDRMKQSFGDRFFIEVMEHGFEREQLVGRKLMEISRLHSVPLVGTNDSHYVGREDSKLHDAMLCLQTRARLSDSKRMSFDGSGYYIKSRREIDLPKEALDNTLLVTERISGYDSYFDTSIKMPKSGYPDPNSELRARCAFIDNVTSEKWDRAQYELNVITSLGFSDYFLTLSDLMKWGRDNGIRFGPGRGSAVGSYVAYLLGITQIDPLTHGLLFERFLNADRVSLPDIDVDIPDDKRAFFLAHVREVYGEEYVAGFETTTFIRAKRALGDAAFVLDKPYRLGEDLKKLLPPPVAGRQPTLSDLPQGIYTSEESEVVELALGLEGLVRGFGTHASAFVLSPVPLADYVPLWNQRENGKEGPQTTQWDMHAMEDLGFVKLDFLGLNMMGVIDEVCVNLGIELPYEVSGTRDQRTMDMLSRGSSVGVFQLDGLGMQRLLKRVKPRNVLDISAVIALYRPGPMGAGAHNRYADRRAGREGVEYPHGEFASVLQSILAETYGLFVYQEQIMAALQVVAGYTLNQADLVRRAMGKKDRGLLDAEYDRFIEGCSSNGYSQEAAQALWAVLVPFADYSFNKSHALGYAYIAYWCAQLKANHPREWFAALLSREGDPEKAREYIAEVRRMGIPVLPPSVNESGSSWTATAQGLRYGLATIKDVGDKAVTKIQSKSPYSGWSDFLRRNPVNNIKTLRALCLSGGLDEFGPRESIDMLLQDHMDEVKEEKAELKRGERRFKARTFDLSTTLPDYKWRAKHEKLVLGVSLSTEPITLKVDPLNLNERDWEYIKLLISKNPGTSTLVVRCGPWESVMGSIDPAAKVGLRLMGELQ